MSKILIAEFRLEDGLGNEEVLLVHRGNGQIFYTLSGKNGGVLHSLKNLQLKENLPIADVGLENEHLVEDIRIVVKSGLRTITNLIAVPDMALKNT